MRKLCILLNMLFIITVALLFNACRKDPYPKPPKPQPTPDWLLSYVGLSYSVEPEPGSPGSFEAQAHYFYYNPSGKPWVHSVINRTFGFLIYERRQDTFLYDLRQRLTEIRTTQYPNLIFGVDTIVGKKVFRYDLFNRKSGSLKYAFDKVTGRYHLTDSAVYTYQDTAITRVTYHFSVTGVNKLVTAAVTSETDVFLYNRKGNLVMKVDGSIFGDSFERRYEDYDDAPNPYLFLNLEGLELEPLESSEGFRLYVDHWIAMDMPLFSKNNYRSTGFPDNPQFTISREAEDSLVSGILRRYFDLQVIEDFQAFQYIPYN